MSLQNEKKLSSEKVELSSESSTSGRSIQEVVDAVTGATWSTRNRIMEDMFQADLSAGSTNLPTFRPPGVVPKPRS